MPDARSRAAVEVSERFADGEATPRELARARGAAVSVKGVAASAAYWTANTKASGPLLEAFGSAESAPARQAAQQARQHAAASWAAAQADSQRFQVSLIREVIGNPFRDYYLDPMWLAWEGGIVGQIARGIYEDRAFDRMPILGDALEESGCDQQTILDHCRSGDEHRRGCWALDLVLDKE